MTNEELDKILTKFQKDMDRYSGHMLSKHREEIAVYRNTHVSQIDDLTDIDGRKWEKGSIIYNAFKHKGEVDLALSEFIYLLESERINSDQD
jgi:hypothetical protein